MAKSQQHQTSSIIVLLDDDDENQAFRSSSQIISSGNKRKDKLAADVDVINLYDNEDDSSALARMDRDTSSSSSSMSSNSWRKRRRMEVPPNRKTCSARQVIDLESALSIIDNPKHNAASIPSISFQNGNAHSASQNTAAGDNFYDLSRHPEDRQEIVIEEEEEQGNKQRTVLSEVLDVFPDCQVQYIIQLCRKYSISYESLSDFVPRDTITQLCTDLAENGYTKEVSNIASSLDSKSLAIQKQNSIAAKAISTSFSSFRWKHDYNSTSWETSDTYRKEAIPLLLSDFPFLSFYGAQCLFQGCKFHYAVSHQFVCDVFKDQIHPPSESDKREETTRAIAAMCGDRRLTHSEENKLQTKLSGMPGVNSRNNSLFLKQPRKKRVHHTILTDETLKEEAQFVKERLQQTHEEVNQILARIEARSNADSLLDCQCCYSEFALEEMCKCRMGHYFCVDCLRKYVENQVFGLNKVELKCMWQGGCSSTFDAKQLEVALPKKVLEKFNEVEFLASVEKANLSGLCKCPKCDFQAILPETEMIFHCPRDGCGFESCKLCGEPAHIPLKCEEVEKQFETKGRVSVEEAMSKARIRHCPSCKKPFYKVDGCNKMTCSCGTKMCYICRKRIYDYKHFCETAHCNHKSCGKCPTFSKDNIKEDLKRVKNAGLEAVSSLKENVSVPLKVDVNSILYSSGKFQ